MIETVLRILLCQYLNVLVYQPLSAPVNSKAVTSYMASKSTCKYCSALLELADQPAVKTKQQQQQYVRRVVISSQFYPQCVLFLQIVMAMFECNNMNSNNMFSCMVYKSTVRSLVTGAN